MSQLLSPKQVAASLGVSESSLKRWCDQGLIDSAKTPGGHRRLEVANVVKFLRETQRPLVSPAAIGLPKELGREAASNAVDTEKLGKALAEGRGEDCRRVILSSYLAGKGIAEICEGVLAPATHQLGDLWTCGSIEVFQERRACEIIGHLLYELRRLLPAPPEDAPRAIGGSPAGDNYRLATIMVEMTLLDAGWRATSLGNDLPMTTLRNAAEHHQPRLMWLSLTTPLGRGESPEEDARERIRDFAEQLPAETHLIVGGRSAPDYGDNPPPRTSICASLAELLSLMPALKATDAPE